MEEKEIRHNFAKNLIKLRESRHISQTDLGEVLSYSSKNISKWENEETIPSITVMKEIADYFHVTIDDLIGNKNVVHQSHRKQNNLIITIISSVLPYVLALILFFVLQVIGVPNAFYAFLGGAIASAITLITLASLWYKKWVLCGGIIYLIWALSLLVLFLVVFIVKSPFYWIVLIIASALSLLLVGLFKIYFTRHINKN